MTFPEDEGAVSPLVEVVEGLVVAGANGLAGYPKTGKSLVATGLGRAIAGGMTHYLGRRVLRHGDVLHVYLEGTRGVPARARAFDAHYAAELQPAGMWPGEYRVWPHPVDLRRDEDAEELIGSLPPGREPVLLIVDTLAASFPGLRGNEEDEKALAYLRFEELIARTGASAGLMVSHTGHADRGREMGSVAGIGRLDNALVATREERSGKRALRVSMARDMDDSADAELPYRVEGVPNSARGSDGALTRPGPVVVAGHRPASWSDGEAAGPAADAATVLELVGALLAAEGYTDSPMGKNELFWALAGEARRPGKKRFLEALGSLEDRGLLRVVPGANSKQFVHLPKPAGPDGRPSPTTPSESS